MAVTFPAMQHSFGRSPSSDVLLLALVAASAFVGLVYVRHRQRNARLPPGPKRGWLRSYDIPTKYQWLTYAKWKELYGDVIYIYMLGNPIIVLNSAEVINDLFEKRGSFYSSRPCRTMVAELMRFDWLISTMPYGLKWRKHRALFHHHFHPNDIAAIHPIVTKEVRVLLRNLADFKGDGLFHHVRRSAAAIVTMLSYGHQIAPEGDAYVTIADQALTGLAQAGLFGTYLVDYLPFLKHVPAWMPGATFKKRALEWRKASQAMVNMPFDMVKQRMAAGTATPCFTATQLERLLLTGSDPEEEELIKNVAGIAFAAGADTTVSAILSFFLAVTVWPEVARKAQEEIDRVIGRSRLPTFDDRAELPYVECIVWECIRWNPVTPLGLARTVTKDDEYRGYHIPKGTTILPNVWAVLHDEATYPEPLRFNPDRFADEKRNQQLGINELPMAAFGFGRRLCPGRWIAIETIWLTVATVLFAFDISKARDGDGKILEPDTEFTASMLSRPKPFQCVATERSSIAASLVRQTE